jgi:ankyrin repeat protein
LLDTSETKEEDGATKVESVGNGPDTIAFNEHHTSDNTADISLIPLEGGAFAGKDDSNGDTITRKTTTANSSEGHLEMSLPSAESSSRDPILENESQEPKPAEQDSSSAPPKEGNSSEKQDKTTTEEDQDDAASSNSEDALEMEEQWLFWQKGEHETPAVEEESDRLRYEITNWIYHLQQAEKLILTEDRSKLDEIWDLIEKFLYTSEDVMKAWHKKVPGFSSKPLHLAARVGLTGLVDRLIKRGEKIVEEDDEGNIPLGLVPGDASPDLLALLLDGEEKSDPNYESKEKSTSVSPFISIINSNPTLETIKILLDHGANPYLRNKWGWCAIHYFASIGSDVEILKLLLDYKGADINVRGGDDDDTPLHLLLACQQDASMELLNAFLDHGADVTIDNKSSQQPLTFVALHGNLDAVISLLEHKADALDDDSDGRNALHNASLGGHLEVVKKLVDWVDDKAALLSIADKGGRTAFYYACQNESPDVAEYLLTMLSDLDAKNINKASNSGKTPLRKAAFRGHTKVVEKLLRMPGVLAAINEANDESKQTALHSAAYRGYTSIIEMFLKAGADTTLKDKDGRTPLQKCHQTWGRIDSNAPEAALALLIDHDPKAAAHDQELLSLAASKGSVLIVKKLLDGGADARGVDEYGWTPLQVATQFGREDIVKLLEERIAETGNKPCKWLPPANEDIIQLDQDGFTLEYKSDKECKF